MFKKKIEEFENKFVAQSNKSQSKLARVQDLLTMANARSITIQKMYQFISKDTIAYCQKYLGDKVSPDIIQEKLENPYLADAYDLFEKLLLYAKGVSKNFRVYHF